MIELNARWNMGHLMTMEHAQQTNLIIFFLLKNLLYFKVLVVKDYFPAQISSCHIYSSVNDLCLVKVSNYSFSIG